MGTPLREQHDSGLQSALRAARENESRWLQMQPEDSTDIDAMEQWMSTAQLRRHEVERLEALLSETEAV
jgi:hypothetical protein